MASLLRAPGLAPTWRVARGCALSPARPLAPRLLRTQPRAPRRLSLLASATQKPEAPQRVEAPLAAPPVARGGSAGPPSPTTSHAYSSKSDLYKALAVGAALLVAAGALSHEWVGEHQVRARNVV